MQDPAPETRIEPRPMTEVDERTPRYTPQPSPPPLPPLKIGDLGPWPWILLLATVAGVFSLAALRVISGEAALGAVSPILLGVLTLIGVKLGRVPPSAVWIGAGLPGALFAAAALLS